MESLNIQLQPFFEWLLRTTLQASVLIALILLVQLILGGKLGIRWRYCLWLVLLIRMAMPWAPQSRVSMFNLIPQSVPQRQTEYARTEVSDDTVESDVAEKATSESKPVSTTKVSQDTPKAVPATPVIRKEAADRLKPGSFEVANVLPLVWLAGALVLAVYVCAGNFHLWWLVTRERPLTDQKILDLLEDCKTEMGIRTIMGVVITDKVKSPALFGFVRPRLLLPAGMIETLSREELRYVFLHELGHLKRHDIYVGYLSSLLQVLHWFNPLIWLAFYRLRADRELACDALVLARTQSGQAKDYGRTIVNLLERFSRSQPLPAMAGILETKAQLKRRITMITQFKKNSYRWSPLAVILIIILGCVSLPDAKRTRASETSAAKPPGMVVRQVWDYARMGGRGNMGRPSPDGRYLLYADMNSINVCALEFATKKMHFITKEKVPSTISDNPSKKPVEFHWGGSIWSPDGKNVAYSWLKFKNVFVFKDAWDQKRKLKDPFKELRTTGLDGSNTRVLYSDDNLAKVNPLDWSSDGKHILAEFIRKDKTRQLVMVSVADGSIRVLKTFDKFPRGDGPRGDGLGIGDLFSPDGRYIVFDSKQKNSRKRDIHILSTDGSREAVLVEHPADDFVLGWTPDGKCLIFASDRTGTMSIWAIRVSEGRTQGDTVLIKKDMGAIWPKGFDRNGSFYYASETKVSDVYIAEIDSETNKILSKPKRASERFVGSAVYLDWSPDGKYLAYISYPGTAGQDFLFSNPVLCIRSLENGEEREIYPELGYIGGACWSPDGRFILTVGKKEGHKGFYKIDVKTGEFTSILQFNKGEIVGAPVWSQDGRKMFYMRTDPQQKMASIIIYDLASKEKKEIHRYNFQRSYAAGRPPFFAQELALSPDGQFLAFNVRDRETLEFILKIIPISGGQAREVVRWKKGKIITTADWTPDGKELVFAESKFQRGYKFNLWRISAEGGEPQKLGLPMDRVYFLRIHPDGQHIAFRSGQRIQEIYAMENFLPVDVASMAGK